MAKKHFRLGAKDCAKANLRNFCDRCYWYYLRCKPVPFNSFPGIFNEFDRLEKGLVQAHIDEYGRPPSWMGEDYAAATNYEEVGFLEWEDEENEITLRGGPDLVLRNKDKSWWAVLDYKTARHRDGEDPFLLQYEGQLLGYAFLLAKNGYKKPENAGLLYMAPKAEPTKKELLGYLTKTGFTLPFAVEAISIELGDFALIHKWLKRARDIFDQEQPPAGRDGCRNCKRIDVFIKQAKVDPRSKDKLVDLGFYIPDRYGRKVRARVPVEQADDSRLQEQEDRYIWLPDWD